MNFQYTIIVVSRVPAKCLINYLREIFQVPGAVGTETIGTPAGALAPVESNGGGTATSGKGGRDGWEALVGRALSDLWDSGEWLGDWPNPFEVSGNGDNKSNPEFKTI